MFDAKLNMVLFTYFHQPTREGCRDWCHCRIFGLTAVEDKEYVELFAQEFMGDLGGNSLQF